MGTEPTATTGKGPRFGALALGALLLAALAVSSPPLSRFVSPATRRASAKGDCLSCHAGAADLKGGGDPGMVEQWRRSVHFARGVTCEACHGTDHQAMIRAKGEVSAGTCGKCHARAVEEFNHQGHAIAEVMAESNAKFLAQTSEMQRQGCMVCHSIGKRFADGSVGKCNMCHLGHLFSAKQAKEPEACITCHVGPDHPQNEAYEESKHGVAYAATRDESLSPTCATCHLPGGNHDVTRGITFGGVAFGSMPEGDTLRLPVKPLARTEFERKRGEMLQVCTACHATSFARDALADADAIKKQTDRLVDQAAGIVEAVYQAGRLDPRPEDRMPNPVEGAALVINSHMLYEKISPLEEQFFELAAFHGPTTWKGAYHQSPDHTHWLGNMKVKSSLVGIESEARRLMGTSALPQPPREKAPAPFSTTFIPPSHTGVPFKPGAKYLGDRYCEGCHADIYRSWRKTAMAAAFGSLYPGADRESKTKALDLDPDKDFTHDASCFPCHTTGFAQPGGFESLEKTPNRLGVQCEACHGPASEYMDHMVAGTMGKKQGPYPGLVRSDVRACVQCHHPSDPCPDEKYVFDFAAMKARGIHELHSR